MRNLKVTMAYRGTAYHGFQRQENAVGIQNVLEEKLSSSFARVETEYDVDPSLIGGLTVEIDGRLIDGSLRHRLRDIKDVISHEDKS